LIDAYQDEVIQLDELRARMGPLRTRQRAIKTEIEALHMETQGHFDSLMVTQNVQAFLTRMEEGEKNLCMKEHQKLIRLLVTEVGISKKDVTVRHCIPLTLEKDAKTHPPSRLGDAPTDFLVPRCGGVKLYENPQR